MVCNRSLAPYLCVIAALSACFAETPDKDKKEKKEEQGMQYRSIGPYRGGRSLTAAGIPGDPTTYYFGSTGGGVWKTTDGAISWKPIFDHEKSSSIGSIAIAPSDPNIIYVGTGEGCIRGNAASGDGIYKSVDAGKTWKNVGLRESRAVARIIVHPTDPDIAYAAVLGHVYGPNPERGIYRTTNGGRTWLKMLYVDDKTGGIDVAFDPHNPYILYGAMWQVRREPWTLTSGGPGSGLYKSIDGGTTWKKLEGDGLPEGPYGKIGVSVGADSDHVYALIEAHKGGLYRSTDGGDKWELVNEDHRLIQRAWYYMHVVTDPKDANTLYVLNVEFFKSTDGGHTFNKIKVPHGDNHGLWIDPQNTKRLIQSDDGGATISLDGGDHWSRPDNEPTAQFYHVITDNRFPYYVYGSQQDNSSVAIASRSLAGGTIQRQDWYPVGGGEAGYIAPYPSDPNIVYAGDYEGTLTRYDRHTDQIKSISVQPEITDGRGAAQVEHRFQWTAPLLVSPHDPNVLYHAGESLFKTSDGGMHWDAISGDLTRNDKSKQQASGGPINIDDTGTEYYDTIFAVAESPLQKGLIWTGSDDGLIQLTRDGGKTWTNVTPKNLPEWSKISQIDASPHDPGTAWVAVDRHANDDRHPYIYATADYGQTWTALVQGIPEGSFVRAVREDPKRKGLLFAGTETGVFVSNNVGQTWESLQLNLPTVPVHDLVIHDNDLVLATHGRAFWILDDLSPLRQQTEQSRAASMWLYNPAPAYRLHAPHGPKEATNAGQNPPSGAVIYFSLKEKPKTATIDILDDSGHLVRSYSSDRLEPLDEPLDPDDDKPKPELEVKPGLNRFSWDLRYEDAPRVKDYYLYEYEEGAKGPLALPGKYQVKLTVDGKSLTAPLEVHLDPRLQVPRDDLEKQFHTLMDIRGELARVYTAANQIIDLRAQLQDLQKRVKLAEALTLDERLAAVQDHLLNVKIKANEDSLNYGVGVDGRLAGLAMYVGGDSDSAPTAPQLQEFDKLKAEVSGYLKRWDALQQTDLPAVQRAVEQKDIHAIMVR